MDGAGRTGGDARGTGMPEPATSRRDALVHRASQQRGNDRGRVVADQQPGRAEPVGRGRGVGRPEAGERRRGVHRSPMVEERHRVGQRASAARERAQEALQEADSAGRHHIGAAIASGRRKLADQQGIAQGRRMAGAREGRIDGVAESHMQCGRDGTLAEGPQGELDGSLEPAGVADEHHRDPDAVEPTRREHQPVARLGIAAVEVVDRDQRGRARRESPIELEQRVVARLGLDLEAEQAAGHGERKSRSCSTPSAARIVSPWSAAQSRAWARTLVRPLPAGPVTTSWRARPARARRTARSMAATSPARSRSRSAMASS